MTPQDFIKTYAPYAEETQNKYGVPASITLAQGALESAWGKSGLTQKANNFFGIKDTTNDEWKGSQYVAYTEEFGNGGYYSLQQPFRMYNNAGDSFNDHAYFLTLHKNYAPLFLLQPTDFVGWANGLKKAGYATDPIYASKLINLVNTYNLSQYDKDAELKKKIKVVVIVLLLLVMVGSIGTFFYKNSK